MSGSLYVLTMLVGRTKIAQRLRRDPVLTIAAMQIAAEHSEAQRARAGKGVKERLFLDGIAVGRIHVPERREQFAVAIEADFADAREARCDGAAMAAGEALHAIAVEGPVEVGEACLPGELVGQRVHNNPEAGL
jgi:hypothetical protein